MEELRSCITCKRELPLGCFYKRKLRSGRISRRGRCKDCRSKMHADFVNDMSPSGLAEFRRKQACGQVLRAEGNPFRWIIRNMHARAKKRGWKAEIMASDLIELWKAQDGICAMTGRPMTFRVGHHDRVSIDRIDPRKGYEAGNVQLTCSVVNRSRGTLSVGEFVTLCGEVVGHTQNSC